MAALQKRQTKFVALAEFAFDTDLATLWLYDVV